MPQSPAMICSACYANNRSPVGIPCTLRDFDTTDTHARLAAQHNGIVKCHPHKATACSVKSVLPNRHAYADATEGPEEQPTSCVYHLSHRGGADNASLLANADTGELVRFHRLWPHQNRWVFCGYYTVSHMPGRRAVRLDYYVSPEARPQPVVYETPS